MLILRLNMLELPHAGPTRRVACRPVGVGQMNRPSEVTPTELGVDRGRLPSGAPVAEHDRYTGPPVRSPLVETPLAVVTL